MKKLLVLLFLAAAAVYAQAGDCGDCGQCWVVGKTCGPSNGRCGSGACEWCANVVRTEFCGIYLTPYSCWCVGLNTAECRDSKAEAVRFEAIYNQQAKNRRMINAVMGKQHYPQRLG